MADSSRGWMKVIADAVDPGNPGNRNDNEPGYLERIASGIQSVGPANVAAEINAAFAANDRQFSEYGGGFVDYSDVDYANNITTPVPAGTPMQIVRNLSAAAVNYRLNRPFATWQPWDDVAKLVRARALFDIIGVRIDIRLIPDRVNAVVRVSMNTPTVELAGKNMPLTAPPGVEEKITVDFAELAVRNSFFQNGAGFYLTANVPMTLVEFSPEFYPLGYEA